MPQFLVSYHIISDYSSQAFYLALCLLVLIHVLVYITLEQHYSLGLIGVLRKLTWIVCVCYLKCHVMMYFIYIFCCQCLSRRFLKEFSVPANSSNTMLDGKLFQLFIL